MRKAHLFTRLLAALAATTALAQTPPATAPSTPSADDTPSIKLGALLFADFTYQQSPQTLDTDGNVIHPSSFNISRAYINVTGNLNHRIAFRLTPEVSRETSSTSSLSGSQEFRLKFAYVQFNLDDWTTKDSWVRFGVQQTPYMDYTEGIYRYRFQGPIMPERVGLLLASDAGLSARYMLPNNYGDMHFGYYNGENFNKAETNNEKALQARFTVRPFPQGGPQLKGLRFTLFINDDHYVDNANRQRVIGQVTYEHPHVNAGFDYVKAKDRPTLKTAELDGKGWDAWVTPKLGGGWEALLRHDDYTPNDSVQSQKLKRDIEGIAYWFPNLGTKTLALLVDRDSLKRTGLTSAPNATNYELKMLLSF
jgi:Phosphate-selective porin O and P